jgi:hypothetical protein
MTQLRGRTIGLAAALAVGVMVLAGCGGHKSATQTPVSNAPASPASAPSSAPASSGGGYGY